jgi:hypothetical protein
MLATHSNTEEIEAELTCLHEAKPCSKYAMSTQRRHHPVEEGS